MVVGPPRSQDRGYKATPNVSATNMQPKAIHCKAEASSRTKSENESHQPHLDMALLEDRVSRVRTCRSILSPNNYFEAKATKTYMLNNLSSPSPCFRKSESRTSTFLPDLAQRLRTFKKFHRPPRWVVYDDRHVHRLPLRGVTSHARTETIAHPPRWVLPFILAFLALSLHFLLFACIPRTFLAFLAFHLYSSRFPCFHPCIHSSLFGLVALTIWWTLVKMSASGWYP